MFSILDSRGPAFAEAMASQGEKRISDCGLRIVDCAKQKPEIGNRKSETRKAKWEERFANCGGAGEEIRHRYLCVMSKNLAPGCFFILALVCAAFAPETAIEASGRGATAASPPIGGGGHPSARLIVQRAPNFGTNLVVRLLIDGRKVADIPRDQHYGGFVSAGRHVLTVLAVPNTGFRRPTLIAVKVQSGHVYIFTTAWEADRLVLRASNYYSPTTRVAEEGRSKK